MIGQPETLLRWHRDFFRFVWRRKSKAESKPGRPPLSDDDIARIKRLARENATWGRSGFGESWWTAQQLREATGFGEGPRFLIRDNDNKYGESFKRVASGIEVLRTPYRAPKANAY